MAVKRSVKGETYVLSIVDHCWILKGNGYGPLMDIVMGICGAVAGGFLARSVGFTGYRGATFTTLVAIIGAALLTLLAGFVNGRRLYARQP